MKSLTKCHALGAECRDRNGGNQKDCGDNGEDALHHHVKSFSFVRTEYG